MIRPNTPTCKILNLPAYNNALKVKCEPVGRPKDSMDPEGERFFDRFFQTDAFEIE